MGLSDGASRSVPEFNQQLLVDAIVKGYYGDEGETSVVETVTDYMQPQKRRIYNLNGQRVEHASKELYIIDGKKTIIK